jgi:hypothetical protein
MVGGFHVIEYTDIFNFSPDCTQISIDLSLRIRKIKYNREIRNVICGTIYDQLFQSKQKWIKWISKVDPSVN